MKFLYPIVLLVASPAQAADRTFLIGGESFAQGDIVDARAQPELDGTSSVRITFAEAAAKRIAAVTQKMLGKPVPVILDKATLAEPVVRSPIRDGVLQLSGAWTIENAVALAHAISGKDPLPDSLEE